MRGLLVTGTGTGVGKTIVSAALLAAMRAAGEPVRAHKPVVTGLDEPAGAWPSDHELLAAVAGMAPDEVAPLSYGPAVSPHLAAALAGHAIDPDAMVRRARGAGGASAADAPAGIRAPTDIPLASDARKLRDANEPAPPSTLIVEGVGGLLVPLADGFSVRDLAVALGLPLLIAAAPGLGTINHTLLTIDAARASDLSVAAVVLTPWPREPSRMERSNRETIEREAAVEVALLPRIERADASILASAGEHLPWRRWLR